jgi:hypothetical protein
VLAAVLALPAILSTSATAAPAPTDDLAAVDAYREALPTASGSGAVVDRSRRARNELPRSLSRKIEREGGTDAARLDDLVTSGGFVAPPTVPSADAQRAPSEASAVGAALLGSTKEIRVVVAAILLATPTIVAVAILARRRRRLVV